MNHLLWWVTAFGGTLGTATGIAKCDYCDMQLRWTRSGWWFEPSTNIWALNPQPILSHLMFRETWSISIETYGDHWMRPVIVILFFGKLPKIRFASQVTWLSHTATWKQCQWQWSWKHRLTNQLLLIESGASPNCDRSIQIKLIPRKSVLVHHSNIKQIYVYNYIIYI